MLSAGPTVGRGRCHSFRRSRSHLEADDTWAPPTVTEARFESTRFERVERHALNPLDHGCSYFASSQRSALTEVLISPVS